MFVFTDDGCAKKFPKFEKFFKNLSLPKLFAKKSFFSEIFSKKLLTNPKAFGIIYHVAGMAQSVEHVIGNDEVNSSSLITSSNTKEHGFIRVLLF